MGPDLEGMPRSHVKLQQALVPKNGIVVAHMPDFFVRVAISISVRDHANEVFSAESFLHAFSDQRFWNCRPSILKTRSALASDSGSQCGYSVHCLSPRATVLCYLSPFGLCNSFSSQTLKNEFSVGFVLPAPLSRSHYRAVAH